MSYIKSILYFCLLSSCFSIFANPPKELPKWIEDAVLYQIYPPSFKDSNGDGIGDIKGIISKLDYIQSIGVNTIWLNPCFHSAFKDGGYDVIDYYRIAPRYGTNEDIRKLFDQAHRRGMRVLLDLVAGHSSDQCPWFKFSQQKNNNYYSSRYIWTNDSSITPHKFVKGNFDRNGTYLKNYFDCQPALNYGYGIVNPENSWEQPIDAPAPTATRNELMHIIDYWMQMGCDGFRVDMAGSLVKNDPELKGTSRLWHEIRQHFQSLYPEGILLAEWSAPQKAVKVGFMMDFIIHFGKTGYRNMMFNNAGTFPRDTCYFDARGCGNPNPFIDNLIDCLAAIGDSAHISIPTGNHDFQRPNCGSRNSIEQLRTSMAFFLTMPGVPTIYYGDEIGMKFIEGLPDKEGSRLSKGNRAGSRTPMQWDNSKGAGFSTAKIQDYYLPVDSCLGFPNVAQQQNDSNSLLNYVKRLLDLRTRYPELACRGDIEFLHSSSSHYPLIYERTKGNERILVCINPTAKELKSSRSVSRKINSISALNEVCCGGTQKIKIYKNKITISSPKFSVGIYKIK
ncbi:MAG: alpha-amylase family glycosyl hydrolase [Muribaculaceae bacterium]|nr:alpha-amylase family glycosyl hydrolase [Muribaculaceae bacterium]